MHACYSHTKKSEAGGLWQVGCQPWLDYESLCLKTKQINNKLKGGKDHCPGS